MSKKPEKGKGGGSGQPDELDELKAKLLAKELEVFTERSNMARLQERSHQIELHIEHLTVASKEKIQRLEDIIVLLNSEGKTKDKSIVTLEKEFAQLQQESKSTNDTLTKQMTDMKDSFEFKYDSLKLQLESATVKLRELHDFGLRKKGLEEELQQLKLQLIKEREENAEALGEAERQSVAIQEKLKKEIHSVVEETEKRMTKTMEEQLHSKTKKTIIENEQLRKEVQYHTHQTTVLLKENEKLLAENHELQRALILGKELENELTTKNHLYQKTTRVLVFKLREKEKQLAHFLDQAKSTDQEKTDEEDLKEILIRAEQLKGAAATAHHQKTSKHSKGHGQEAAIEFLYACLEDMELERVTSATDGSLGSSESSSSGLPDAPLDQLNPKQRLNLLKELLKRAMSIRSMTDNMVRPSPNKGSPRHIPYMPDINTPSQGKNKFDVEDILALTVGRIMEGDGVGSTNIEKNIDEDL